MTDKIDDWELFENTSNNISKNDLLKLLEKIQQTNDNSKVILDRCNSILDKTLLLQKSVNKIHDSIQINELDNIDNIDNIDNKAVRNSNRAWRMYGNSYTQYPTLFGFNPIPLNPLNPLNPIKKADTD